MPRSPEDLQRLRDEKRERILTAARGVFARRGFAAAKMADIAVEAAVSHGLVYHYFPSKEAVYRALVELAGSVLHQLIVGARAREGTAWTRLHWLCTEMLARLAAEPDQLVLVVQAFTLEAVPADVRATLYGLGIETLVQVQALIAEGQQDGDVVAGDPSELTLLFFALVQGLTLNRLASPDRAMPSPDVNAVLRLLRA
jgi:AcrR family transcriptional regulator